MEDVAGNEVRSNQNVSVPGLLYIPNHTHRHLGGDCGFIYRVGVIFSTGFDIILWYVCLVLSTGAVKNGQQEQSIYGKIFYRFYF